MEAKVGGRWDAVFQLSNVCIHASLLPTGKILYWGRRKDPQNIKKTPLTDLSVMHEHTTSSFLLDLGAVDEKARDKPTVNTPTAKSSSNPNKPPPEVNLFCSGHTFLPDGKLLVVGGHERDGVGIDQASIFNPFHDNNKGRWEPQQPMGRARWYPTAIKLPDGNILVTSGSASDFVSDVNPQLFRQGQWKPVEKMPVANLYPRLCIDPNTGSVFMSGPSAESQWLHPPVFDPISTVGVWGPMKAMRGGGLREYAPSVMYDSGNDGNVLFIGGGVKDGNEGQVPDNLCEIINLKVKDSQPPKWGPAPSSMKRPRRQHNGTILCDGTVLVTGGTSGAGFNNTGLSVHTPELWDPITMRWKDMADESRDRCYHSIALLLPTGQVLSAGGGEWIPSPPTAVNDPNDTHTDAQIFNPPYLFDAQNKLAKRPTVLGPPEAVKYGEKITVTLAANDDVKNVTWIHIGSVTHCNNQSQSFLSLKFDKSNLPKLVIDAPASPNLATPGHYMLFIINKDGVPAIAPIIKLIGAETELPHPKILARHIATEDHVPFDHEAVSEQIIADEKRPAIAIGLTPICPYGLGPCWGGAYEALQHISDVELVRPVPSHEDSLAFVYTEHDILPDIDVWRAEFRKLDGGAYTWRGIETTLSGVVTATGEKLTLAGNATRSTITLAPFQQSSVIKWDMSKATARSMTETEASAYERLLKNVAHDQTTPMQVTGTLHKLAKGEYSLDVRDFGAVIT
ncbi:galactose oxidase [Phaeosphaeriaceae sp. SRC1lsM3a]|nr:galactose oxidase [Stagonospora sp. SRC1lsM3a]